VLNRPHNQAGKSIDYFYERYEKDKQGRPCLSTVKAAHQLKEGAMNSLTLICKTLAAALTITFFLALSGHAADTESAPQQLDSSDPNLSFGNPRESISAKDILTSGAAEILGKTRVGKRLDELRKSLIRRYRFEYQKEFKSDRPSSTVSESQPSDQDNKESRGLVFHGRLDHRLAPVLGFKSRLDAFTMSSTLRLLGHEIACDISSRPIDRLMGGRAGLEFVSDGARSEAMVQLKFEF